MTRYLSVAVSVRILYGNYETCPQFFHLLVTVRPLGQTARRRRRKQLCSQPLRSVVRSFVCYRTCEHATLNAKWSTGQGHEMTNFVGHEVKGQGHNRSQIDLEANVWSIGARLSIPKKLGKSAPSFTLPSSLPIPRPLEYREGRKPPSQSGPRGRAPNDLGAFYIQICPLKSQGFC